MANENTGAPKNAPGRKFRLTNLNRDVVLIPVEGGGNAEDGKLFRLGDKEDTDDKLPDAGPDGKRVRDERFQPNPQMDIEPSRWEQFGGWARERIEEFISMGRISRMELV